MVTENARMRQLRDTEANWILTDPVLLDGEIAVSSDILRIKVGDGTSAWSALPYYGAQPAPDDGFLYGYEGITPARGTPYKDYSGDLNAIDNDGVTHYNLVNNITNAWPNYNQGDGTNFLVHMQNHDGGAGKIQIGYSGEATPDLTPIIHQRRFSGGSWTAWRASSIYNPTPYAANLDNFAVGGGWQGTVPLDSGIINGPPGISGEGCILTHTQNSNTIATQVVIDTSDTDNPRMWVRTWDGTVLPGSWTTWASVGPLGTAMVWRNEWVPRTHNTGEVVIDDGYLMVANKPTSDRAAPQPQGDAVFLYAGASPTTQVTAKQTVMGQRFFVPPDGRGRRMSKYRIWTVVGNEYSVFGVQDPEGEDTVFQQLGTFTGFEDGWTEFNINPVAIPSGITFDLVVTVQEPDPSPTILTYSYNYTTPGGGTQDDPVPVSGQIAHGNGTPELLSIHYTDNGGTDRTAALQSLAIGDVVEGAGIRWSIQSSEDRGAYITFTVAPQQQGALDGVQDFNFETITATPVTYVSDPDYFGPINDPDGNVQGLFGADIGYGDIVPDDSAYGVDIEVETVITSDDWDFMAYTPNSDLTGGGGEGGGGASITIGDTFPASPDVGNLHYLTAEPTGLYVFYADSDSTQWVQTNGAGGTDSTCPFPVNAIYMSTSADNPATLWAGTTWEMYAQGRTVVGVGDNGESDWTGGEIRGSETHQLTEAEMPSHNHLVSWDDAADGGGSQNTVRSHTSVRETPSSFTGGDQPHNNVQPSIATYMWRRLS